MFQTRRFGKTKIKQFGFSCQSIQGRRIDSRVAVGTRQIGGQAIDDKDYGCGHGGVVGVVGVCDMIALLRFYPYPQVVSTKYTVRSTQYEVLSLYANSALRIPHSDLHLLPSRNQRSPRRLLRPAEPISLHTIDANGFEKFAFDRMIDQRFGRKTHASCFW